MGHRSLRSVPGIQQRLCTCYSLYFVVIVRRLRGPGAGLRTIPASQNLLSLLPTCLDAWRGLHLGAGSARLGRWRYDRVTGSPARSRRSRNGQLTLGSQCPDSCTLSPSSLPRYVAECSGCPHGL